MGRSPTFGLLLLPAAIALLVLPADPTWAQRGPQRLSATRLSEVDEDFAWQGEFLGQLLGESATHRGRHAWGMQVVALGDGRFSAALLRGGLPGRGAQESSRETLSGQRNGEQLVLRSDTLTFDLDPNEVRVFHRGQDGSGSGRFLGRLTRVHRGSPTMGLRPPPQAEILFVSPSQNAFSRSKVTEEGWLLSGVTTPSPVEDFVLHLEFQTPYMPYARGQARGNSGVYIQRRYEVQILDSFGLEAEPSGNGGLYRQQAPDFNMSYPPLTWQTYDIHFRAARFDDQGEKISPAYVTVFHNGVAIHYQRAIPTKTGAGQPEGSRPLPIYLQDHGNPVMFRNVWIVNGTSGQAMPQPQFVSTHSTRKVGPLRRWLLRCR